MPRIHRIIHIEKKLKDDKPYYKTHVILDDGEEATGYGKDYKVGDKVQRFYDATWDTIKIRPNKST